MISDVALLVLWMAYASFEGAREANYWYLKISIITFEPPMEEHKLFTYHRATVLAIFGAAYLQMNNSNIIGALVLIPCAMVFPFIHDGVYYLYRDKILPGTYPKGFWDHSSTSTAWMTKHMDAENRTMSFIIGTIFYIGLSYYLKVN